MIPGAGTDCKHQALPVLTQGWCGGSAFVCLTFPTAEQAGAPGRAAGLCPEPAGVPQGGCGFPKMETLAVPLERRVMAWISARSRRALREGAALRMCLGMPRAVLTEPSATCRHSQVATSSADPNQPQQNRESQPG